MDSDKHILCHRRSCLQSVTEFGGFDEKILISGVVGHIQTKQTQANQGDSPKWHQTSTG